MHIYIFSAVKSGTHIQAGWSQAQVHRIIIPVEYTASKIGVSALTGIHQSMFNADPREDIAVNAVHPGFVDTDLTSHEGTLTPDQGAVAPVYCALLPENTEIKGKYIWYDTTLSTWE